MTSTVNHSSQPLPVQALLDEAVWIRSLARRLARDAAEADDLVQETLVSALENPPDRGQPRRAWLAIVVANAARALRRSGSRREARERVAARPEALPSTAELVERALVQRELVEAVLALDEPYREIVLLRFYEGLPPRTIARRLQIPVDTVRTRLARAVARLRTRLDQQHGGKRMAWLALVLPPPEAASLTIPLTGGILLNAKLAALTAAAVLAVVAFVFLRSSEPASPTPASAMTASEVPVARPASAPAPELGSVEAADARTTAARPPSADASSPAATVAAPAPRLRGVVLDSEGRALSGVPFGIGREKDGKVPPSPLGTSGADGRFDLDFPAEPGPLVASGTEWSTVLSALPSSAPGAHDAVLVVASRLHLSGFVVDAAGAPVEDARLAFEMPEDLRPRFTMDIDRSVNIRPETRSDADGRFEFSQLPRVRGAKLTVSANGFDAWQLSIEEIADPFTVVLTRPGEHSEVLQGIVVDAQGTAVEKAHVAFGIETVRTDADGRFVFSLADPRGFNARWKVSATLLRAIKAGFLPAQMDAPMVDGQPRWPASVTLRLGTESLSISGRVKARDGEPRAGLRVWAADSEVFGAGREGPLVLENVLAGIEGRSWSYVETDEDGRFEIRGLLPRAYVLRAQDPENLLMIEESGVDAGRDDVEMRMPADGLFLRVAGTVRGHDGTPVAGVSIHPMCDSYRARFRGDVISTSHDAVDGVVTDSEGRFVLQSVPRSLVYLRLDGAEILPLEYGRYAEGDPRFANAAVKELPRDEIESLDIRVDRRAHLQIQLTDPALGDRFRLLDTKGDAIELSVFEGNNRREGMDARIVEGRSPVVSGSDRGRTLVLLKGETEVGRRPVTLKPGETTIVPW